MASEGVKALLPLVKRYANLSQSCCAKQLARVRRHGARSILPILGMAFSKLDMVDHY